MKIDIFKLNERDVLSCVSNITNVPVEYMLLPDKAPGARKKEYVESRQLSMYILRIHCKYSFARAGAAVMRDHATAMHAIRTLDNLAWGDKSIKELIDSAILECREKYKQIEKEKVRVRYVGHNVISIHPRVI